MNEIQDRKSATSPIFVKAMEALLPPGGELELFSSDHTDDVPEAKAMEVDFKAIMHHYRAESRAKGVWILFWEMISNTIIPGYPDIGGKSYSENLRLCTEQPRFERDRYAPKHFSPTLECGSLLAEARIHFNKNRRLERLEIRLGEQTLEGNAKKEKVLISLEMVELISHASSEFIRL